MKSNFGQNLILVNLQLLKNLFEIQSQRKLHQVTLMEHNCKTDYLKSNLLVLNINESI